MLDTQFIGLNLHFAVNLFAALVCFAVFWLIFDAWSVRHERKELLKWAGFLALCLGFLLAAASSAWADWARLIGYLAVAAGQLADPLQKRPDASKPAWGFAGFGAISGIMLPATALLTGALYLRRSTTGLERHLRPLAYGFGALAMYELLSVTSRLQTTTNPVLYRVVGPYGLAWWATLAVLVAASLILGNWVWQYLTKRLQTQLFMILVAQTLVLFLVSTVGFTYLLLRNIRTQSLADLTTASRVLDYALASRQSETAAQSDAVASNPAVAAAVAAGDRSALSRALGSYMTDHGLTTLTVTDASGMVLLRSEDPERFGDSRSSDPLIRRANIGTAASSVVVQPGVTSPTVTLVAASPIRSPGGAVVGVVSSGRAITGAFVDGIRESTGLSISVYGGNTRAATTLVGPDGINRAVGVVESSADVKNEVLTKGHNFSSTVSLQNTPYLASYTPLRNVDKVPVGMLLVARSQSSLYSSANQSVQLTFVIVVLLIIIAIYPVYRVSRFLASQLG